MSTESQQMMNLLCELNAVEAKINSFDKHQVLTQEDYLLNLNINEQPLSLSTGDTIPAGDALMYARPERFGQRMYEWAESIPLEQIPEYVELLEYYEHLCCEIKRIQLPTIKEMYQ